MAPTSQAATNSDISNAYNQGQQLQSQYNSQMPGAISSYQGAQNTANNTQSALTGFTNNMVNGNQLYGQNLSSAQQMYGFDPTQLLKANQNLAQTQDVLNNLPQAIAQQGNYSGATAGALAGNYANSANNINGTLGNQTNAVNAFNNVLSATQNQANQQTGQALTGQGQQLQGYTAAAQNAQQIMQNAMTAMNNIETLAQQQGGATASQVAAYQQAYNGYITAQAAATTAAGSYAANEAQAQLTDQQYANTQALQTQLQQLYGPNWSQALQYLEKGQTPPSNLNAGSASGVPLAPGQTGVYNSAGQLTGVS